MNIYYVSLVRSLMDYYVKFAAESDNVVREHVHEYYGKLWCSVYDEEYFNDSIVSRFRAKVINDEPVVLRTGIDDFN
jgi:hypothetical protein